MSSPYPVIVVGYDGSAAARAAIEHARRRLGDGGRMYVVAAYDLPPDMLGYANYDRLLAQRQEHAHALLDELDRQADERVETELVGGSPAEAIDAVARARDADEIVVGARGHSRARALLGSVSSDLLHLADRPVVVIPAAAAERAGYATDAGNARRGSPSTVVF